MEAAGFPCELAPEGQIAIPHDDQIQAELQPENDDWRVAAGVNSRRHTPPLTQTANRWSDGSAMMQVGAS